MYKFFLKNYLMTISEYKKEISFLCFGIILSLFMFCQTAVSFYGDVELYGAENKQEKLDSYNLQCFKFNNSNHIIEIASFLTKQKSIKNVSFEAHLDSGVYISANTHLPKIPQSSFMTASYQEDLKDGEIITDYNSLSDGGNIQVKRNGKELAKNGYSAIGDEIIVEGISFVNKAEIAMGQGILVTINDFAKLMENSKDCEMQLFYEYKSDMGRNERAQIATELGKINPYESTWGGVKGQYMDWLYFVQNCFMEIIGTLLAMISTMFIFRLYIRKKLKMGAVLKLQGVKNSTLRIVWSIEFVAFYVLSAFVAVGLYMIYMKKSNLFIYDLNEIIITAIGSIFMMFFVMLFVFTQKYVKMQPYEMYVEMKE